MGSRAQELLERLSAERFSLSSFKPFTAKRFFIGNVPGLALRVSYVGEDGWEIYTETGYGLTLWDTLWDAGGEFGPRPAWEGLLSTHCDLKKGTASGVRTFTPSTIRLKQDWNLQ